MQKCMSEAVTRGVLQKKFFLEISQDSQEKQLCHSLFLNKVEGLLRAPFLKLTPGRLLLACLGKRF